MNIWQRNAWISLLFFAPLWLIFGQLPVLLVYLEGPSWLFLSGFAFSTIIGGLSWLFLLLVNKRKKETGTTKFDERDQLILIRSVLAAYAVLWLYFVAACIYAWLSASPERSISVNVMPMAIVGGIVVFLIVQSLTTLIQYGRRDKDNE